VRFTGGGGSDRAGGWPGGSRVDGGRLTAGRVLLSHGPLHRVWRLQCPLTACNHSAKQHRFSAELRRLLEIRKWSIIIFIIITAIYIAQGHESTMSAAETSTVYTLTIKQNDLNCVFRVTIKTSVNHSAV